jgi:hypothetical protein
MLCEYGFIDESEDVEPLGKYGLRWDVKQVLRGDEDEEDVEVQVETGRNDAEQRSRLWKKAAKKIPSLESLFPGKDIGREQVEQLGEESLTFHPHALVESGIVSAKDALAINSEGQVSTPLLGLLVIDVLSGEQIETLDVDGVCEMFTATVIFLENKWRELQGLPQRGEERGAPSPAAMSVAKFVSNRIVEVTTKRIEGTRHHHLTITELLDQRDVGKTYRPIRRHPADTPVVVLSQSLPANQPLTRMALSLLIEERKVLEVTVSKWQELLHALQD